MPAYDTKMMPQPNPMTVEPAATFNVVFDVHAMTLTTSQLRSMITSRLY